MKNLSTQIATTREQSERLLSMGVNPETSDMSWKEIPTAESFANGTEWQQKQSPWISVEERLPPQAEHVLLKKGDYYVGFGFFGEKMIFHSVTIGDNSLVPRTVAFTHWMPIPELLMKILDLPLKAVWYLMIESGIKKEEYREITEYWIKRLAKCKGRNNHDVTGFWCKKANSLSCVKHGDGFHPEEYTHVRFRYGYTKRTMLFKLDGITIGKGKPDWGAPDKEVFVLRLGEKIE